MADRPGYADTCGGPAASSRYRPAAPTETAAPAVIWSGTVARRCGQKAAASRMSSGPLFGSVACPVRMPPKSSPATQMNSRERDGQDQRGPGGGPPHDPGSGQHERGRQGERDQARVLAERGGGRVVQAGQPVRFPGGQAAERAPHRGRRPHPGLQHEVREAAPQHHPGRPRPALAQQASARDAGAGASTGTGRRAGRPRRLGRMSSASRAYRTAAPGAPVSGLAIPAIADSRAAGPFGQQPHRQGPPDGGVQRRAGGAPPQQPGGQRELDGGERGVPRHHVVRDDPRRRGRRAGQQRWVAHAGGFQHAGDEVPAEHVRLVLQGRVEQPHQAERDLQAAPPPGRVAVRCPGQRGPGGCRAAQRGLRRGGQEQGGEGRGRAARRHPQARAAARHHHGVAAEHAHAAGELDEQVRGETEGAEPGDADQPAGRLAAADQVPDPGRGDEDPRGGEHPPVNAADAGNADEPGERLDPGQQCAGDDGRSGGDRGQRGGGLPAAQPRGMPGTFRRGCGQGGHGCRS